MIDVVPRGTHDPLRFIRPAELRRLALDAGLMPGPFRGFGPRGLARGQGPGLDLAFGPWPTTAVQYLGSARKPATGGAGPAFPG